MIRTAAGERLQLRESPSPAGCCGALFLLAKPGIVAAVTLSGFTGMVVAGKGLPEAASALSCLISLLLMAAGSALINNVLDCRIDQQMGRLARRSAALRRVGKGTALAVAALMGGAALLLSSTHLNARATALLIAAALSYTLYYTLFLKRHSHWAALLGGLPGALPILIGQAAVTPRFDAATLALFLVMLIWQPPHFWLLSLFHREEYRAAGLPVLPLVKGEKFTRSCIYLGVALLTPAALLVGQLGSGSTGYALCTALLGLSYLAACHRFLSKGSRYRAAFKSSILYLMLLFSLIVADLIR